MAAVRFLLGWCAGTLLAGVLALLTVGPALGGLWAWSSGASLLGALLAALAGWCLALGLPVGLLTAWHQRVRRRRHDIEEAKRELIRAMAEMQRNG